MKQTGIQIINTFLRDEQGQSVVEYALLMTMIGAVVVLTLTLMGLSISRMIGVSDITVENYTSWAFEKFKTKE